MWSDNYCYTQECLGGPAPVAAQLYGPQFDAQFAQSIGGMVKQQISNSKIIELSKYNQYTYITIFLLLDELLISWGCFFFFS